MMVPHGIFRPVKQHKGTLYENVARQVEALITNESLKPGEKLPAERELAEIFGVSRACIREAVQSLAARGYLSVEHGRGVFVRESTSFSDMDANQILKQILWASPEDLKSLFEIRKLLEPQGTYWAAVRASETEIDAMGRLVDKYRTVDAARVNFMRLWETDTKLHMAIARASHNPVLVRIMESMLDLLADVHKQTLQVTQRVIKSGREHLRIWEAIQDRNAPEASRLMMQHLENVETELIRLQAEEQ